MGNLVFFTLVVIVMCGLAGLGAIGGLLIAKHRERKCLQILNEVRKQDLGKHSEI